MLLVPGAAEVKEPLIGELDVRYQYYDDDFAWKGYISGDLNGWFEGYSEDGWAKGKTWFFMETWVIKEYNQETGEIGPMFLAGTDEGVISPNSHYTINGVVTEAGEGYEHLIGRNIHASGYITWDPTGWPLTAPGTFRIN